MLFKDNSITMYIRMFLTLKEKLTVYNIKITADIIDWNNAVYSNYHPRRNVEQGNH